MSDRPEEDEFYVTMTSIRQEIEEVLAEATQRPITDDEAQLLAFWCGAKYTKRLKGLCA